MIGEDAKRKSILADRFVHAQKPLLSSLIGEKELRTIQGRVRLARKFVFDTEATRRVARVVREIPELILRESHFARAPFDVTWIEYDALTYWRELNDQYQGGTPDTNIGILIDHNRVNTVVDADLQIISEMNEKQYGTPPTPRSIIRSAAGCGLYPVQYYLNTEWPVEDQLRFAQSIDSSRLGIDMWMWGSSANYFNARGELGLLRKLRDHNVAEWIGGEKTWKRLFEGDIAPNDFLRSSNGDMRTIIAFLLMLNRPSIVQYKHTLPNTRRFLGNKVRPFMSHTIVEVSLDATKVLKLIGTLSGDSVERRRHEVRGHYCHDQAARDYMRIAGCIHSWKSCDEHWTPKPELPPAEVNHWLCSECGGKRWWRVAHERGTAQEGFVAHEAYAITASES